MTTKMQKTILDIANYAKVNNIDPISALQEYFEEKDSRLTRARVAVILADAIEAEQLAIGFYYAGTLQEDGMVVFSRTPTGQWR
jgi:hypothetical protein